MEGISIVNFVHTGVGDAASLVPGETSGWSRGKNTSRVIPAGDVMSRGVCVLRGPHGQSEQRVNNADSHEEEKSNQEKESNTQTK